jgi:hypothetical protein
MSFPQLQKHKGESQKLDEFIGIVEFHLKNLLAEQVSKNEEDKFFNYRELIKRTDLDSEDVLLVLDLFEREHILTPKYIFYCPETHNYIESYYSLGDVPIFLECDNHYNNGIVEHESVYCDVEICYAFSPTFIGQLN